MLTGQAKTDYQREYMKRKRAGLTSGSNGDVRPNAMGLTDKLKAVGLTMDGNIIEGVTKPNIPDSHLPNCPDGRYIEIDADGNIIPDFT